MTYSYAHPVERFSLSLARRWLLVYPLAQILCLGFTMASASILTRLDGTDIPHAALVSGIAAAVFYGVAFGYLRGVLLREKLTRFAMLTWCGVIAVVSLYFLPPVPQPLPEISGPIVKLPAAFVATMPGVLAGFLYGIVIGTAEALTLRRAASGLLGWIVWSAFAWGIGHIGASVLLAYGAPLQLTPLQTEAMRAGAIILQSSIAGLFMLPALGLLAPKLDYYGPRVYRTTLRARGEPLGEA